MSQGVGSARPAEVRMPRWHRPGTIELAVVCGPWRFFRPLRQTRDIRGVSSSLPARTLPVSEERAEILRLIDGVRRQGREGRLAHLARQLSRGDDDGPDRGTAPDLAPGVPSPDAAARLARYRERLAGLEELRARLQAEFAGGGRRPGRDAAGSRAGTSSRSDSPSPAVGPEPSPAAAFVPEVGAEPDDLAFSGRIQGEILSDMLQLVSSNALTGVFGVRGDPGTIELYFREGQVFHADGGGLEGEAAFFAAFAMREGRYWFRDSDDLPDATTLAGTTQFLILEALRRIDEESGDDG